MKKLGILDKCNPTTSKPSASKASTPSKRHSSRLPLQFFLPVDNDMIPSILYMEPDSRSI